MYSGGRGRVVLVDMRSLVTGRVEDRCADGFTGCPAPRMTLDGSAMWTSWGDLTAAQTQFTSTRSMTRSKAGQSAEHGT